MKDNKHPIKVDGVDYNVDLSINGKPAIYEVNNRGYVGLRHIENSFIWPVNAVLKNLEPGTVIIIGRKS